VTGGWCGSSWGRTSSSRSLQSGSSRCGRGPRSCPAVRAPLSMTAVTAQALAADGINLDDVVPAVYDEALRAWQPLERGARFALAQDAARRVDVKLLQANRAPPSAVGAQDDGFFQIGIVGAKTEARPRVPAPPSDISMTLDKISAARRPLAARGAHRAATARTQENVGTLWRSAFQLGASVPPPPPLSY